MPLQAVTNQLFVSPPAAASIDLTTTGVAWTSTAWSQIAASTDTQWVLTEICIRDADPDGVGGSVDLEIDIGVGGAGSEVVIATSRWRTIIGASEEADQFRIMIPITGLNGRHSCRLRTSSTRSFHVHVAIQFYKQPIAGQLQTTAQPTKVWPAATNTPTVTSPASPWVFSAWTQIIASTSAAAVLTHAVVDVRQAGGEADIEIGVGGAGAEVTVAEFRADSNIALGQAGGIHDFPNPIDKFPAGSRVSYRVRCDQASVSIGCALVYQEKPL